MKRIIFVLPSLRVVSPVKAAFALIKSLTKEYNILVVSLDSDISGESSIKNDLINQKINFIFLNQNKLVEVYKAKTELQKLINEYNPDIILSYLFRADLVVSMIKTRGKRISSIRNMVEKEYTISYGRIIGTIFGFLHKRSLKKFDQLIVMSNGMFNYFVSNGFERDKLVLIYNFLDEENVEFNKTGTIEFPFVNNLPTIVTVSSLIKLKNIPFLINGVTELMKKGLKFNVLIIGDGEERNNLQSIIDDSGYKNNFCLLGHVGNPIPYMIKSDIFVMTSLSEGISRSLMEALYLGKICVVSNIDGNNELIENGVNGYLYDNQYNYINILQNAINKTLHIQNGFLEDKFRYKNSINGYKKLFNEVLRNKL